jgi:hypothetical protein
MKTLVFSVYWDDVGVPGRKSSWWSNTGVTIRYKTEKSTVKIHSVLHDNCVATETGGQMRAVAYYSVRLRKSEGPTPRCTNTIKIFLRISKTTVHKPVNKEGLLHSHWLVWWFYYTLQNYCAHCCTLFSSYCEQLCSACWYTVFPTSHLVALILTALWLRSDVQQKRERERERESMA